MVQERAESKPLEFWDGGLEFLEGAEVAREWG